MRPPGRAAKPATGARRSFRCLLVTIGTTRDSAPLVLSTAGTVSCDAHAKRPQACPCLTRSDARTSDRRENTFLQVTDLQLRSVCLRRGDIDRSECPF